VKPKLLFIILILISSQAFAGSVTDDILNTAVKAITRKEIRMLYNKALACNPLEYDAKSNINVTDWIKLTPELPDWKMLKEIPATANAAKDYAQKKSGTDKVLHCFAGCFIAKKLDYTSAVLTGWLKELNDAGDCSASTHFEKFDYDATTAGAIIGNLPNRTCESFCQRDDVKNLDGDDMLEFAKRELSDI
jgi:hypothetical protein